MHIENTKYYYVLVCGHVIDSLLTKYTSINKWM